MNYATEFRLQKYSQYGRPLVYITLSPAKQTKPGSKPFVFRKLTCEYDLMCTYGERIKDLPSTAFHTNPGYNRQPFPIQVLRK
jgi:hypothetical protein